MRLGALILTGGRSERMRSPKEFVPFAGETLLGRTAATLLQCCDPVLVVRRDAAQTLPPLPDGPVVVADERPGAGPLAALATGLRHLHTAAGLAATDAAFVTGCDSPFLTAAAVRWLCDQLGDADLALPAPDGVRQPLCAVYRLRALTAVDALLARGVTALRTVADEVVTRSFGRAELEAFEPELRFLRNVNTPADLDRARGEEPGR